MSTVTASSESPPWRIVIPSSVALTGIFFGLLSIALAAERPYAAARVVGARSSFGAELPER